MAAEATSMIVSIAPISWKWIFSIGLLWIFDSACAIFRKISLDLFLISSSKSDLPIILFISLRFLSLCCSSGTTTNFVDEIPCLAIFFAPILKPFNFNFSSSFFKKLKSRPRSSNEPVIMSPLIPEKQSK